jgi:predicted transcriptional regulator
MAKYELRSTVLRVRIRPSLKAELDKLAERDQRSLSSWIEAALSETVAGRKKREATKRPRRT